MAASDRSSAGGSAARTSRIALAPRAMRSFTSKMGHRVGRARASLATRILNHGDI